MINLECFGHAGQSNEHYNIMMAGNPEFVKPIPLTQTENRNAEKNAKKQKTRSVSWFVTFWLEINNYSLKKKFFQLSMNSHSPTELCHNLWIIYYIADLPVTRLRLLTNKSDNIAVPYASLRSLILLLALQASPFLTRFYEARGMLD